MSKAFAKEDADTPEAPVRRRGVPVPDPNYITAEGLRVVRAELEALSRAGGADDRVRELADHLATAQVVLPESREQVGLGASVTVEDEHGKRITYRIVSAIEADAKRSWVSWQSPIANAMWNARVGDMVDLPRGAVEIVAIAY